MKKPPLLHPRPLHASSPSAPLITCLGARRSLVALLRGASSNIQSPLHDEPPSCVCTLCTERGQHVTAAPLGTLWMPFQKDANQTCIGLPPLHAPFMKHCMKGSTIIRSQEYYMQHSYAPVCSSCVKMWNHSFFFSCEPLLMSNLFSMLINKQVK